LVVLGIASWPPGGLMFALPFVFLIPGIQFGLIGSALVWTDARWAPSDGSETKRRAISAHNLV
jgi:hypothetical protein